MNKRENKKGVSPVVATVLLVAIVIVIALLIFLWARGFIKEAGQKMGMGEKQACDSIVLEASYDAGTLSVLNNGNIPVYSIIVEKTSAGSTESDKFENRTLGQGSSDVYEIGEGYESIRVIPVILVEVEGARKEKICEDNAIVVL